MDSLLQRLENAYRLLYGRGKVKSRADFGAKIGKSQTQVSDAFNDRHGRLTMGLMKAIADAFPNDINRDYMLTGVGSVEKIDSLGGLPHFSDLTVAAGYFDGYDVSANDIEMRPEPVGMGEAEFSIDVSGDSMYPEIQDGDTLFLTQHTDRLNLPLNKIVVVDSTEGGGVVKKLTKVTPEYFYLHSLNPDYRDIKMRRSEVRHLYRVVGISRLY